MPKHNQNPQKWKPFGIPQQDFRSKNNSSDGNSIHSTNHNSRVQKTESSQQYSMNSHDSKLKEKKSKLIKVINSHLSELVNSNQWLNEATSMKNLHKPTGDVSQINLSAQMPSKFNYVVDPHQKITGKQPIQETKSQPMVLSNRASKI